MPKGEPKKKGSMTPTRDRISQAPRMTITGRRLGGAHLNRAPARSGLAWAAREPASEAAAGALASASCGGTSPGPAAVMRE